ncbi:MAG: 1-deoxy-D-xylulose-5-phosphate synthase [Streptococcaceae bacterium]|jgi:1-deoxy-D-xylulose-5-phosphate synthase|nr:1-deoxy-D-xylulose-5-phosphate synthase [Streptococcaceae bacterium]
MVLEKINGPEDVKKLSVEEMKTLAAEMNDRVVQKTAVHGGHIGPNLGVSEMTIALHYVFNSPIDKLVWDVSHQTYPHKMLTGRKIGFEPGHYDEVMPYTNPGESVHDFFNVGHTSTSIANAVGLAKARDMAGETGNIIAIIGDGSLSGGLALEALNNAAQLKTNLIIIANDNQMSIDKNYGGLYENLRELRESEGQAANNLFKAFNLDYKYLADGNDIERLISLFQSVKDIDHPIVLHINTEKGHGWQPAIDEKRRFHWGGNFDPKTGKDLSPKGGRSWGDLVPEYLGKKIDAGEKVLAINAAIPGILGLVEFYEKYPDNYWDAGIAEQFTMTFGGAASTVKGVRPIIFHNSTFVQRAYDQLMHDISMNNEPAIVVVAGVSINSADSSHQGSFGTGWLSTVPNFVYLAPTNETEFTNMMDWAIAQHEKPVMINLPQHGLTSTTTSSLKDFAKPKYDIVENGADVAILGLGGFFDQAHKVSDELAKSGVHATLVNPLFIRELDTATLDKLAETHKVLATFEDNTLDGGFGQRVASYLARKGVKVLNFGALTEFVDEIPTAELYQKYHLTPELASADILDALK